MYEPVLTDEKLDLYNVYEIHENYRILAMAVNVPLQVAEEICHILNNFEPVILKTCPICDQSVTINEYISDYLYSINCECCGLKTRRFRSKQNLIKYCKDAIRFRKNGQWINNFGYQGFITSEYSLKNPYQKPFDFTQVKVYGRIKNEI